MEYSLLKDVSNTAQDWRVRVRIARLWEHHDAAKGDGLICLHLVLVDEKADGIHGLIPKGLIAKFQPLLQEGHVYYLQYMEVVPVTRSYRTTYHGFELRFTTWTNVVKIDPVSDAFPLYAYRLRSIRDIASTVTDKTYLADVIGLINGVSALTEVDVKGTRTPKRNLRITDGRDTAILALWGDNATQIDADELVRRGHQEPVIVIAMGCTFKIQDSMVALTGSYGSKICLNLANPDVTTFRNRITGMDHSVELIAERTRRLAMNEVEQTTVTYLASVIPHIIMNKVFRCKITVQSIAPNQTWWFRSCDQCTYKAVEDGDAYRCSNRHCINKTASPRYKLPIIATDGSSTVEMVFFGDVGRDLVGRPADVLLSTFLGSDVSMPSEIIALVGRKYVVEVTVSKYSFRRDRDGLSFRVRKFFSEGSSVYHDFVLGLDSSSTVLTQQVPLSGNVSSNMCVSHSGLPQGTSMVPAAAQPEEGSHHARMHMLQRRGRPPPGITTVSTLLLHQSSILQYFTSTNRLHQESRTRPFHLFAAAQSQNVDLADLPQDTSTATGTVLEIQSEIRNITDAAQRSSTPPGSVLDTSAADMLDKVKDKESRPKRGRTSGAKSSASKKLFVEGNDAASHGMDK